jgi:hypothetical protein
VFSCEAGVPAMRFASRSLRCPMPVTHRNRCHAVTGDAYFITYNAQGRVISPVTGRAVGNDVAHYPIQSPGLTVKP